MRNGNAKPSKSPTQSRGSTERSDFAAVELAHQNVGAGAPDSPFGEERGLNLYKPCRRTKTGEQRSPLQKINYHNISKQHQTYKVRFNPMYGLTANLSSGYKIKSPIESVHAR